MAEMKTALPQACIVRIFTRANDGFKPVGVGFYIKKNTVITCSHVLCDALGISRTVKARPAGEVAVDFPFIKRGKHYSGHVCTWIPGTDDNKGDIATVSLTEAPEGAEAVLPCRERRGKKLLLFGCPPGYDDGAYTKDGELVTGHRHANGWIQVDGTNDGGQKVRGGYSGGPAWDADRNRIVGMVVGADVNPAYATGVLIPSEEIENALNITKSSTLKYAVYCVILCVLLWAFMWFMIGRPRIEIVKSTGQILLPIQAKNKVFLMGMVPSPPGETQEGDPDELQPHKVMHDHDFLVGSHEVTQAAFDIVMNAGPNRSTFVGPNRNRSKFVGPNLPVTVMWFDAIEFCNKLSVMEGREPYYERIDNTIRDTDNAPHFRIPDLHGTGYRLLTESEWEFVCRAGSPTKFFWGDRPDEAVKYAYHSPNNQPRATAPQEVGLRSPNPFGLYDITGNVWEWCWDFYSKTAYPRMPNSRVQVDPIGHVPDDGYRRVLRGGSYNDSTPGLRSSLRNRQPPVSDALPGTPIDGYGFRIARTLD